MYENICVRCNPDIGGEEGKKKGWSPPTTIPSIYVGETAKSLYERGEKQVRLSRATLEFKVLQVPTGLKVFKS